MGYKMDTERLDEFNEKVKELDDKKAEMNLAILPRKHFEKVEGLTPSILLSIKPILSKK